MSNTGSEVTKKESWDAQVFAGDYPIIPTVDRIWFRI
jgi:hypothetical protein